MSNYVSGWGGDRVSDSLTNGDWGWGSPGSNQLGDDKSSGYPMDWSKSDGAADVEGAFGYNPTTINESPDFNFDFSSLPDLSSLGNGNGFSSAENRGLLNEADSEYRSTPAQTEEDGILKRYRDAVAPLQPFLKNPIVSTLMSLNPATAVLKTLLGGPNSVGGYLGSMFSSNPLGKIIGSLAGSQAANYATTGSFAPMSGTSLGGILGGIGGGLSGIPYGAQLGSYAGSQLGGMSGDSGGGMDRPIGNGGGGSASAFGGAGVNYGANIDQNLLPTGMNNGYGGGLANLGMAYNTNRTLGNQINTLEGLFGQNSAYATQMRQQLERRDAAAGRRSQYGNREVELQAALAGNAAKLQPGLQQLYSQKNANTNLLVQSLLRNPNLLSGLKEGWNGLTGMFQNNVAPPAFTDADIMEN